MSDATPWTLAECHDRITELEDQLREATNARAYLVEIESRRGERVRELELGREADRRHITELETAARALIEAWDVEHDGGPRMRVGHIEDVRLALGMGHPAPNGPCVIARCVRTGPHETHIMADGTQWTYTNAG